MRCSEKRRFSCISGMSVKRLCPGSTCGTTAHRPIDSIVALSSSSGCPIATPAATARADAGARQHVDGHRCFRERLQHAEVREASRGAAPSARPMRWRQIRRATACASNPWPT